MRLLRYGGMWPMLGYGYWAIEEKASGALVGDIGYADFMREMTPPLDGMPEMGWVLASSAHGKGYASEALAAISAWGAALLRRPSGLLHHRARQCRLDPRGGEGRLRALVRIELPWTARSWCSCATSLAETGDGVSPDRLHPRSAPRSAATTCAWASATTRRCWPCRPATNWSWRWIPWSRACIFRAVPQRPISAGRRWR